MLEAARCVQAPELDRIVVALDPAVTAGSDADACGIVVVGAQLQGPPEDWRAYVLADRTLQGVGPAGWARAAIDAMDEFGAERLVAEVNPGGQLVEEVVRQVDPLVPYRAVRASRGKVARVEPVAALYEQGRVRHVAGLDALEEQIARLPRAGSRGRGRPTGSTHWSGRCMSWWWGLRGVSAAEGAEFVEAERLGCMLRKSSTTFT